MPESENTERPALSDIYSQTVIDHVTRPRNAGYLNDPDGAACMTGQCGDTMEIRLKIRNGAITAASFMTDGCGSTIAAGSMVTEMATGKSVSEAAKIRQRDVLKALGGLPAESEHCALLAADTLSHAIRDYLALKKTPWKRAYRKL